MATSDGRIRLLTTTPLIVLIIFALCAIVVDANPSTPGLPAGWDNDTTFGYPTLIFGFIWIAILNYAVNLFLFSLLFIVVALKYREGIAEISANKVTFFGRLFITVLIITIVGSFTDMIFLMRYSPTFGEYRILFDFGNWLIAMAIIFLSITMAGVLMMRVRLTPNLIIASVLSVLNLLFWSLVLVIGDTISLTISILSLLMLSAPLSKLLYWHANLHLGQ
jgi:hypothetical protein